MGEINEKTMGIIKALYKKYKPINIIKTQEAISIGKIIDSVDRKKFGLPKFQRENVWKVSDVKSLLESIFLYHFIGNFVIWKIKKKKEPLQMTDINNSPNISADGAVLDGKQRITSLYKVLDGNYSYGKNEDRRYFYIDLIALAKYYASEKKNVPTNIIIERKASESFKENDIYENFYFPLNEIKQYNKWITKLREHHKNYYNNPKDKNFKQFKYFVDTFIQGELKHFWEDPLVPVINLVPNGIPSSSAAMIFELINRKGVKLNTFDILVAHVAQLSGNTIDLRNYWNNAKNDLGIKEDKDDIFGTDLPLSIIQGMHLYYSIEENVPSVPSEENIKELFNKRYKNQPNSFEREWNEFVKVAKQALHLMKTKYGVIKKDFLPATSLLPPLIAILAEVKKYHKGIGAFQDKIDRWYWSAVFSGEYRASTTTHMAKDVKEMKSWLAGGKKPKVIDEAIKNIKTTDLKNTFNGAIYRGILSLLFSNDLTDLYSYEKIKDNDRLEVDHIFPKNMFEHPEKYNYKIPEALHKYKNSILNRTLSDSVGNESKNDKPPSNITQNLKNKFSSNLKNIITPHCISDDAFKAMEIDDFEKFLEARGKAILKEIRKRIMPPPNLTQPRNTTQHDNTRPNKHNTTQHDQKYRTRPTRPNKTEHSP